MAIRLNRGITDYLKRKKVVDIMPVPTPKYEMGTLHPHSRPVTPAPWLRPVDSPATKVITEEL